MPAVRVVSNFFGSSVWSEGIIPAATAIPEKPIPFALISNDRTSTGYSACKGVNPIEYTAPKMKMNTKHTTPATEFVPMGASAAATGSDGIDIV